jgi:hypothetical protein
MVYPEAPGVTALNYRNALKSKSSVPNIEKHSYCFSANAGTLRQSAAHEGITGMFALVNIGLERALRESFIVWGLCLGY